MSCQCPPVSRTIFALLSVMLLVLNVPGATSPSLARSPVRLLVDDPTPPASPVKLIFIHHSSGENWLSDNDGGLGIALRDNNYFVSDTNYGWGPDDLDVGYDKIGDHTDLGHWYNWFAGPHRATYLSALYTEYSQNSSYSRLDTDPGGENQVIMFKSCFPNSHLGGNPTDPPTPGENPLRGQGCCSDDYNVANAKGIYNDLRAYFQTRLDRLFIVITAPPLTSDATDPAHAANARAFNTWLVNEWLAGYPYQNVAVFDFYNVLTHPDNHHRFNGTTIEYVTSHGENTLYYPGPDGEHPSTTGNQNARDEFAPLLNVYYHRWRGGATPTLTLTAPNGGEVWDVGSQHAITWSSANLAGTVRLDFSTDGFTTAHSIAGPIANSGSYAWTVPATPTTSARVRVSSVLTPTIHDDSDANFVITTWSHFLYLPLVLRDRDAVGASLPGARE